MELIAKHDCIYIIDDNTHSLTVLKNLLLDLNYSVRVANRGSVAIKSILMDPPDLIILDLIMPDMDGYEVCKELRNNQNTKDIPIIFVSALDEIESKVKALNTGGNDYITKPYHIEEVSARIQTHLYIRKLQKKLESKNTQLSQEIIERKQVEVQISKLSQAIKEIPSTFMITDIKGNIEFVNPSFTKLTGYTSKEIVGQSSRILKSGKTTTEEYKRMWKTITTGGTWRGELSNKKKDGELYWESASISSMKDPDGVISNFIKVAEDITERRKIDAERLRLSKILEMTSDLVSTATVDGNVTYMNFSGRQMVGWNDDFNVSTKKIQDAHPEHAFNIIKNEVIPYVMKNGVWEGETALINSEGREIPVSQVIMLHRSPERKAEFLSTIMRDISDRNQIENELLKKNSFLNLLQVAAVAANEAEDINDAFLPILEEICRNTGWEIGHAYAISENDPDLLKPTEVWCLEEQKPYIDFCNITKKTDFARGVGLPGRVLSSGKPHWIENVLEDSNFLRKQIALDLNIHSGIAFPVIVKHSVVAVLEFFTTRKEKPDQQFMEIMADVGTNLGRVVERSRAKEAVVQSEKRLRSYFDLGLIGMALTSLQKGWIEFNDTLCSMLGYTRNDFAKLTWTELTHPDDLESDLAQFNRVIAGEVDGYSIEKRFIHSDGSIIYTVISANAVRKTDGSVDYFAALVHNITERKNMELTLEDSEERYRSLINDVLDTSNVGVFILDKEFKVVWINKALESYFGLKRDDIIMKDKKQLIKEKICYTFEDGDKFKERVLRTYDDNTYEENFVCHILSDDSREERWLEHWSQPIISGLYTGGRVEHYTDITKRKQAEEALVLSEKMKAMGIMTAGVAHEFNNILAVISCNAQLLEETSRSNNELSKSLLTICRMADDGAEIVDRMYDFTNARKDTSHYIIVELMDLIKQVINFTMPRWKEMAQADGIEYQIVRKDIKRLPSVMGNPSELREVILNIVNNSLDAMPDGGKITVKTQFVRRNDKTVSKTSTQNSKIKRDFVEITFTDTGKGMTEEVKKMMFDPFFTTRSPQGTGLGMSVSYGIISRHGGEISVESELDQGCKIILRLPVSAKSIRNVLKPRQDSKLHIDDLKILLVDDKKEICESLSKLFTEEGYKVYSVSNGAQAIKLLKENKYDLLLCDLVMPGITGKDVLKAATTLAERPKVGLMTGWRYKIEDAKRENLGVDFIIKKPFNLSKLRRDINDLWS